MSSDRSPRTIRSQRRFQPRHRPPAFRTPDLATTPSAFPPESPPATLDFHLRYGRPDSPPPPSPLDAFTTGVVRPWTRVVELPDVTLVEVSDDPTVEVFGEENRRTEHVNEEEPPESAFGDTAIENVIYDPTETRPPPVCGGASPEDSVFCILRPLYLWLFPILLQFARFGSLRPVPDSTTTDDDPDPPKLAAADLPSLPSSCSHPTQAVLESIETQLYASTDGPPTYYRQYGGEIDGNDRRKKKKKKEDEWCFERMFPCCFGKRLRGFTLWRLLWISEVGVIKSQLFGAIFRLVGTLAGLSSPLLVGWLVSLLMVASDDGKVNHVVDGFDVGDILPSFLQPSIRGHEIFGTIGMAEGWTPWIVLIGIVLCQILRSVCVQYDIHVNSQAGLRLRTTCTSLLFRKSMRLSGHKSQKKSGMILNLIAADCSYIDWFQHFSNASWSGLLTVVLSVIMLQRIIGWESTIVSIVVGYVGVMLTACLTALLWAIRKRYRFVTDQRLGLLQELLRNIGVVKISGWSDLMGTKLTRIRGRESCRVRVMLCAFAVMNALISCLSAMMMLVGFVSYVIREEREMPVDRLFAAMAFFNNLKEPMVMMPNVLVNLASVFLSLGRIEDILLINEKAPMESLSQTSDSEYALQLRDVEFADVEGEDDSSSDFEDEISSSDEDEECVHKKKKTPPEPLRIHIPDWNVKHSQLIVVVGNVGSGKSCLLRSLLGEFERVSGHYGLNGRVSFCDQRPWLRSSTLRDNIVFGSPFSLARLNRVIEACGLREDLEAIDGGDMIELGDNGMNLSGGQQYRVALARACYSDADIVLIDSPFAAVDPPTGRHIFDKCICGLLRDRTRIVVTHQVQYCSRPEIDQIVIMNDGEIVEVGHFEELMQNDGPFSSVWREYGEEREVGFSSFVEDDDIEPPTLPISKRRTIQEEARPTGFVKWSVIKMYMNSWGGCKVLLLILCVYLFSEILLLAHGWYLSNFSSRTFFHQVEGNEFLSTYYVNRSSGGVAYYDPTTFDCMAFSDELDCRAASIPISWDPTYSNGTIIKDGLTTIQSLSIYLAIGVVLVAFTLGQGLLLFNVLLCGNDRIVKRANDSILGARMQLLDQTPNGRILSRFSSDVRMMDIDVIYAFDSTLSKLLVFVGFVGLIAWTSFGLFLLVAAVLLVVYFICTFLYRAFYRELNRLASVTRSPLTSHFSETLRGVETIRAFRVEKDFIRRLELCQEAVNKTHYLVISSAHSLEVYLSILGSLVVFATGALAILVARAFEWPIELAFLSFGVTSSMLFAELMNSLASDSVNFETRMNALERLHEYCTTIEQEGEAVVERKGASRDLPKGWIKNGRVSFHNVCVRYSEDLPWVLKNVSFDVKENEKVGLVGRTGAGKSSILRSWFRIVEPEMGTISVDDIDVQTVSIGCLRRELGIIPQNPVLFRGTIRSNLDPERQWTIPELWDGLRRVHLGKMVQNLGGLETEVEEEGKNFSVGERQLLALARASCQRKKVLAFDEATANIDVHSDRLIQKTLREEFSQNTIITIAHRLATLADYDRILVLGEGEVLEFDAPDVLLQDPRSEFSRMVNESPNPSRLRHLIMTRKERKGTGFETWGGL